MENVLVLSSKDNVGNAIEDIRPKDKAVYIILGQKYELMTQETIPFGFKVAVKDIKMGQDVLKYGEVIGKASRDIIKGELVHIHNMEGKRGRGDIINR